MVGRKLGCRWKPLELSLVLEEVGGGGVEEGGGVCTGVWIQIGWDFMSPP